MQVKGTIVPKEKLKEMGMNFEVYESKGVVKFKNGIQDMLGKQITTVRL
jgi:hypothetical protein